MQSYKYDVSVAPLSCQSEVEQLIKDSLHTDWAIFVEYSEFSEAKNNRWNHWNRWGKAYFAVQSATAVIDAILACRACFPHYYIRLYAEKYRPSTKLIYCVHDPSKNISIDRVQLKDKFPLSYAKYFPKNEKDYSAKDG